MIREEMGEKKIRKTRSDKKRDVKPTISVDLKNCIYRLSYITNVPVKEVVEIICEKGLKSRTVIECLSIHFRREYQFRSTLYIGEIERKSLQRKFQSNLNERVTTRFSQETYEEIRALACALDVTPSKATSILLDASIRNTNLLNSFVKVHLHQQLDKSRMKGLEQVLLYINRNNPYEEEISWFVFISMIFEDIKENAGNMLEAIHKWTEKNKGEENRD